MSEMVERIATRFKSLAMFEDFVATEDDWRFLSRLAIEAMREPTEEMYNAPTGLDMNEVMDGWRRMIDAALVIP